MSELRRSEDSVRVLNVSIHNVNLQDLLQRFTEGLLVTPNVDHLIKLQRNREFYQVYKGAEWVVCDSTILSIASRILGNPIKEVISGSSLFPQYYMFHKDNPDVRIFLLGAKPGVADRAMETINSKVGREIIVGSHSPSFGFERNEKECDEIVAKINATSATVLVVGVGAPKQELWINRHRNRMPNIRAFMALGATIDFEAGVLARAPVVVQRLKIEWLYRLMKEPRRLWRRYLVDDPPFVYLLLRQRFGCYKDPFADLLSQ